MSNSIRMPALFLAAALAVASSAPADAQVPAQLPYVGAVEPSAPLQIDGMYVIREINKRVVIENGYAYAVEGWNHALLWQIMPDQIYVRDITPLPDGSYVSQNLTMNGQMTFEPKRNGTLVATMRSGWPGKWHYDPVGYDESPYPDPGYDEGPLPAPIEDPWGRAPDPDPDAGEAPVNPWSD